MSSETAFFLRMMSSKMGKNCCCFFFFALAFFGGDHLDHFGFKIPAILESPYNAVFQVVVSPACSNPPEPRPLPLEEIQPAFFFQPTFFSSRPLEPAQSR